MLMFDILLTIEKHLHLNWNIFCSESYPKLEPWTSKDEVIVFLVHFPRIQLFICNMPHLYVLLLLFLLMSASRTFQEPIYFFECVFECV